MKNVMASVKSAWVVVTLPNTKFLYSSVVFVIHQDLRDLINKL